MSRAANRQTASRQEVIEAARKIVGEFSDKITIRQLYYQLVSRQVIPNIQKEYKRLVAAMADARRSHAIPFDAFEDRSRDEADEQYRQETGPSYVQRMLVQKAREAWMYVGRSRWYDQPAYVEVWVEKQALQGIFESALSGTGVPLQVCKGYPSLSILNAAAARFQEKRDNGVERLIIQYFGDFDPSGEDIPRSIEENLASDFGINVKVRKLALTPAQIEYYQLPPDPAKMTDSRTARFIADTGSEDVVELDALNPKVLKGMVEKAAYEFFDTDIASENDEATEELRKDVPKYLQKALDQLVQEFKDGKLGSVKDDDEDEDDDEEA